MPKKKNDQKKSEQTKEELREEDLRLVAYVHGQGLVLSTPQINAILGEPTKSGRHYKLREKALAEGYLVDECRLGPRFEPRWKEELHEKVFASCALRTLAPKLQALNPAAPIDEVYVFDAEPDPAKKYASDKEVWDARVKEFGRRAARVCWDFVQNSHKVGCCFGRQLAALARGMGELHITNPPDHPIDVFPVMGDACIPMKNLDEPWEASEISATGVAEKISSIVNKDLNTEQREHLRTRKYSLNSVPIMCPESHRSPEKMREFATVLDFFAEPRISDYRAIFGNDAVERFRDGNVKVREPNGNEGPDPDEQKGLVYDMDCLLATTGGPKPEGRFWTEDFFALIGKNAKEQAREELVGDIGGIWLPKLGRKRKPIPSRLKEQIEQMWTCIDEGAVRECYRKGREEGAVGVVALCVGTDRAEIARAAAASGMVNRLCLDFECARELFMILNSSEPAQ